MLVNMKSSDAKYSSLMSDGLKIEGRLFLGPGLPMASSPLSRGLLLLKCSLSGLGEHWSWRGIAREKTSSSVAHADVDALWPSGCCFCSGSRGVAVREMELGVWI